MPTSWLGPFEYVGRSDHFRHFSTPRTLAGSDSIPGSNSKLSIFHIRMADIHKKSCNIIMFLYFFYACNETKTKQIGQVLMEIYTGSQESADFHISIKT